MVFSGFDLIMVSVVIISVLEWFIMVCNMIPLDLIRLPY